MRGVGHPDPLCLTQHNTHQSKRGQTVAALRSAAQIEHNNISAQNMTFTSTEFCVVWSLKAAPGLSKGNITGRCVQAGNCSMTP